MICVLQNGAGQQMCPHTCGIIWLKMDDGCGSMTPCCNSCRTVDALSFYTREEQAIRSQVEREKAKVKTKSIGIAFVIARQVCIIPMQNWESLVITSNVSFVWVNLAPGAKAWLAPRSKAHMPPQDMVPSNRFWNRWSGR